VAEPAQQAFDLGVGRVATGLALFRRRALGCTHAKDRRPDSVATPGRSVGSLHQRVDRCRPQRHRRRGQLVEVGPRVRLRHRALAGWSRRSQQAGSRENRGAVDVLGSRPIDGVAVPQVREIAGESFAVKKTQLQVDGHEFLVNRC
jgi:hypothetical protein